MLATGGLARNKALREQFLPRAAQRYSLAPEANTGDGLIAALRVGAAIDDGRDSAVLWMPCSILRHRDGSEAIWPHIVLDRAKPGLIAVNSSGRRFVNKSNSYHDFVMGMLRSHQAVPSVPAYLICSRDFILDYGIGLVFAGTSRFAPFIKAGYLIEGATLSKLATKIGVPSDALERTVADHNRYAKTGVDEEFGRGSSSVSRFNGDPTNRPNSCMRPIGPGPYYAVAVWPADLASSAGLRGDVDGRAFAEGGRPNSRPLRLRQ